MGLLALILVVMVGLGIMFSLPSLFGEAGAGIGEAFVVFVEKLFSLLALSLPVLTIVVIFYFGLQKEKTEYVLFSAVYGILVFLVLKFTGVFDKVADLFYASYCLYEASIMDTLAQAKECLIGVGLFVIGAFNRMIDEAGKTWNNLKKILGRLKK